MNYFAFLFLAAFLQQIQVNSSIADEETSQMTPLDPRGILAEWLSANLDKAIPHLFQKACKLEVKLLSTFLSKTIPIFFKLFDRISGGRLGHLTETGHEFLLRILGISMKIFENFDEIATKWQKLLSAFLHHKPSNSKPGKKHTTPNPSPSSSSVSSESVPTVASSGQINLSTPTEEETPTTTFTNPPTTPTHPEEVKTSTSTSTENPTTFSSSSSPEATTHEVSTCCNHPAGHWSLPYPGPGPWIPITADGVPIDPDFD